MAAQLTGKDLRKLREVDRELYDEIVRKMEATRDKRKTPPYVQGLFGPQREFFEDDSKKKAALCSRRAGKTEAVAAWLLEGARDCPGGSSVYIALSRNNCRMILWKTLREIDKRYNVGLRFKERDNQIIVITPNDHEIWLAGCKDSVEIEKFRGMKFRRAAIDEGASYGEFIRQLVEDVLEPALIDLNGEICIIGTPGVSPTGYFFEITTGAGKGAGTAAKWSTHSWTIKQNPYIQLNDVHHSRRADEVKSAEEYDYRNSRATAYLERKLKENRWTPDNPTYRREWLGEWVLDGSAIVFPYNDHINACSIADMPGSDEDRWVTGIGVDVGYNDPSAFTVARYRPGHPELYFIHAEKHEGMIPSKVAAHIVRLKEKYGASVIVMDTGGIGKGYAEECKARYSVNVQAAEKHKKLAFIEFMRGDLMNGNIKADPSACSELILEWQNLVWHETKPEPDPRFDDHLCDSALYLYRMLVARYRPRLNEQELTPEERVNKVERDHYNRVKMSLLRGKSRKAARKKLLSEIRAGRPMY